MDPSSEKSLPFLNPMEWDFRRVASGDLITAILFEYTRSSHAAKNAIEQWHAQPLNANAFLAFSDGTALGPLATGVLSQRGITHAEVIERVFDVVSDGELPTEHLSLLHYLSTVAALALPAYADPLLAARFSTFQKSWNELRSILKPGNFYLRLLPPPAPRKCLQEVIGKSTPYSKALKLIPTLRRHRLMIDWAVRADQIEKALLKWARTARQKAVGGTVRPGGNQPREVLLKFLAAYRFRKAGYNFIECQDTIRSYRNRTNELESALLVLPVYGSKGKWEDAARKAEGLLNWNFVNAIRGYFGYPRVEW